MEGVSGGRENGKGGGGSRGARGHGSPNSEQTLEESSLEGEDCAMRPEVYWVEVPLEGKGHWCETHGRDWTPG